ncbi:hypothetical protein [Streptomyces sp. OR43]|uniref:hypothetical protein n=1 Tax=Streptomyces sp. or43 TaxID=2478957 RepID=UPI0011CE122C|nr:hypothetical protein [Streptomyces sp. or43]TXS36805.1 hypothetical protein EAO72_25705 [Streptomyces sp. or43]
MNRQTPLSAAALYGAAATSAVMGALLWLRSRNSSADSLFLYGGSGSEIHSPSAWRVWSSAVTEERLGMYLLGAALALALAARLVATWRDRREHGEGPVPE